MPIDTEAYNDHKYFLEQLADIETQLQTNPNDPTLLELKKEIFDGINILEDAIPELKEERLKSKSGNEGAKNQNAAEESHPASTPGYVRTFASGDHVQARRRGEPFSPAVVLSVLGPPTNPNYVVRFKADKTTITAPGHDVRPAVAPQASMDGKKRKADDDDASTTLGPAKPTNVISAPPALNPEFLKQKETASLKSLDEAGNEKKKRKVGSGKRLEESRSTWQAFQGNMKKKQKPKESMFRTGEGLNARVGVIGSGKGMRKDQKRQKNEYARVDEYEGED